YLPIWGTPALRPAFPVRFRRASGPGGGRAARPGRSPVPGPTPHPGSAFVDGYELLIFRPDVVGRGANDLVVDALLDDVRCPAGRTCDHEQRREHCRGNAHHVVRHGREPVEVGEHRLDVPHHCFEAFGNVKHLGVAGRYRHLAGYFLDDLVARVGHRVHGVTETDD